MSTAERERPVYQERSKQMHVSGLDQFYHLGFYPGDDVFFMVAIGKEGDEWEQGNFSAPMDLLSVTVKSTSPRKISFSRRDAAGSMSISFEDADTLERYLELICRLFADYPGIITTAAAPTGGG